MMTQIIYHMPQLNIRDTAQGKHTRERKGPACKVPDADVAAIRYLHEVQRKTIAQVCRAFPHYQERYVRQVLHYVIRAKVKPAMSRAMT